MTRSALPLTGTRRVCRQRGGTSWYHLGDGPAGSSCGVAEDLLLSARGMRISTLRMPERTCRHPVVEIERVLNSSVRLGITAPFLGLQS